MIRIILMENNDVSLDAVGRDDAGARGIKYHTIIAASERQRCYNLARISVHDVKHRGVAATTDKGSMMNRVDR